jgi:hypothetical protein
MYGSGADFDLVPFAYRVCNFCLVDQFDFARPPRLSEERFQRTVKAKQRVPALCGVGLNPVAIADTGGFGRTKIYGRRAVSVCHRGRSRIDLLDGLLGGCAVHISESAEARLDRVGVAFCGGIFVPIVDFLPAGGAGGGVNLGLMTILRRV